MREMKQTDIEWIGKVPIDWKVAPLWAICSHKSSNISQQDLPDIDNGIFPVFGASGLITYVDFYKQEEPSIGMVKDGAGVGNSYLLPKQSSVIGTMSYIIPKNKTNIKYLHYLLQAMKIEPKNVSTTIPHIYFSDYGKLKVPNIAQQIQADIANYLDDKCEKIDTLIENEEKVIDELKEYKKSIIQKATTKGVYKCELKDSDIEWFQDVPTHWGIKNASSAFFENCNYNSNLHNTNALKFNFGTLVPKPETIIDKDVEETLSKYTIVKPNDIAINGLNLNYDFLTQRVAIATVAGVLTSSYIIITPRKSTYPPYYNYLLKVLDNMKVFNGMGTGIRLTMTYKDFRKMQLLFPPLPEQKAIAEYLDKKTEDVDKLIAIKKQKIDELKEYKKSLIYDCVTGKKEII